ncbi:hypothetical protein ACJX0J_012008, partial [Zea mays]
IYSRLHEITNIEDYFFAVPFAITIFFDRIMGHAFLIDNTCPLFEKHRCIHYEEAKEMEPSLVIYLFSGNVL